MQRLSNTAFLMTALLSLSLVCSCSKKEDKSAAEAEPAQKANAEEPQDKSPETQPKAEAKLEFPQVLPLPEGSTTGLPDAKLVFDYCNKEPTPNLGGFQVTLPKGHAAAADYAFTIRGTAKTLENEEGYMVCDTKTLEPLGTGEATAKGNLLDVSLEKPTDNWPCFYEVDIRALDGKGQVTARGQATGNITCPE